MRAWILRYPLVSFFVLAYGFSWAYWIPLALTGQRVEPGSDATYFPGLVGPAVAAWIVSAVIDGRAGVAELWARLFRVSPRGWRFWLYSLSPLGFLAMGLVVSGVSGAGVPSVADFSQYSGLRPFSLPVGG